MVGAGSGACTVAICCSDWAPIGRPCPRAVDVRGTSWIVRAELGQFRTGFSHSDFRGLGRLPLGSVLVCAA